MAIIEHLAIADHHILDFNLQEKLYLKLINYKEKLFDSVQYSTTYIYEKFSDFYRFNKEYEKAKI